MPVTDQSLAEWARSTLLAVKTAAEQASAVYPPPWTARYEDPHGFGGEDDQYPGDRGWSIDCPFEDTTSAFVKACGSCEHSGIAGAPGRHVALHDPRAVAARCEADLATLVAHRPVSAEDIDWESCVECRTQAFPCRAVRLLAWGLRFYDEAGYPGPEEMP